MFPFKIELKEALLNLIFQKYHATNETLKLTTFYLSTYQLMFHLYKNKSKINEMLIENKLSFYKSELNDVQQAFIDSFPKVLYNFKSFDKVDKKLFKLASLDGGEDMTIDDLLFTEVILV
jgi:hypothetical protein